MTRVFDHVTIRAGDSEASRRFYDVVLPTIGIERQASDEYLEWGDFSVAQADDERPVTRRLHIAFFVPSQEQVEAFWRAGTDAGYRDDGEPGLRPQYREDYFGAFMLDPDGNSVEAVHHGTPRRGSIDHLWLRVHDLDAAKAFYETVAPYTGFELRNDRPGLAQFAGEDGSFSLVRGEPTANVHIAFAATGNATVEAFHSAAIDAGHRDNGGPGEREIYHPGYYGAFVLDPDGNNIEVVNHNR